MTTENSEIIDLAVLEITNLESEIHFHKMKVDFLLKEMCVYKKAFLANDLAGYAWMIDQATNLIEGGKNEQT
jgi:hypothetical protein